MTEHTGKTADNAGKAAPGKRGGKSRSPRGKRAKAPGQTTAEQTPAGDSGAAAAAPPPTPSSVPSPASTPSPSKPANPLAPDPATITFGSNRPIVASPPKLPESSGLRFSGPSAGELKASGPQPTSPKASGLTFSSGKTGNGKPTAAKPLAGKPSGSGPSGSGNGTTDTKGAGTNGPGPQAKDKDAAKAPGGKPGEAKALDSKKADSKKADSQKADAKVGAAGKPGVTKPAIAPQATGRHFDKERSTGGFLAMGVVLTVVVCGLAFWIKLGSETPPTEELAAVQTAPQAETTLQTIPDTPVADTPAPAATGRSSRMPGGQAAGEAQAPARTPAQEMALSTAEIAEIQNLLSRLDFDPGSESGVLSAATTAAIRSYQEMAGLPADGSANQALLEELRSVVALYGS